MEGIAGGLWNILYCEALAGRGHRLPLLAEYISYVVLTPYLGAEAAVEAIVASRVHHNGSSNGAVPLNGNGPAGRLNAGNGSAPAGEQEGEDYRRLAERRSAKCVNTTPTSTESTITTIKGA